MAAPLDDVLSRLGGGPLAPRVTCDAPLGLLTTYRVGGAAAALVTVGSPEEVDALCDALAGREVATLVVGRGSNLLVGDAGFAGIAVFLDGLLERVRVEGTTVTAGGAAKLPVVARAGVQAGLAGFEWAVGVPGSVGGAVRMNAGGHGAEIIDSLDAAEIVDLRSGERRWRPARELRLTYRSSAIAASDLVVGARLLLAPGDEATGKATMAGIVRWRRDHQPGGQNAGSVFTNPPGDSAGRLIEAAGLKGCRVGTAEVSTKHANFIQADPDGRADDVRRLMDEIRRRVHDHSGIELHAETRLVGFGDAGG